MRNFCWIKVVLAGTALSAQPVSTWEMLSYTPPAGFNIVQKPDGGGRVELTKSSRTNYCVIVIYSSTPAGNNLEASFASEWKAVMLKTISAVATPFPAVKNLGNTRAAVGRATSTAGGQPVSAMLVVLDAGVRVLSMIVLTPTLSAYDAYATDVEGMLSTLSVQRANVANTIPPTVGGRLVIPPPGGNLTIADFAGEWGHNDGITTSYVDRSTGVYVGSESLHFTNKWTFSKNGGISLDFFAIRNGKKIIEKSNGTAALAGGILVIRMSNMQRYVFRGWLDLPDMTIMKLNGPWYDDPIPSNILSNPEQGVNLDQTWVRKK